MMSKWGLVLILVATGCFTKPPRPGLTQPDGPLDASADTRTISGRHWVQPAYTPGPAVVFPALAYDSDRQEVLLYGGSVQDGVDEATMYRLTLSGWQVVCGSCMPGPRHSASFAYDPIRHRAVLVGGYSNSGYADMLFWEWDGSSWTAASVALSAPRAGAQLVFDPMRSALVLIGGTNSVQSFADAYTYDGAQLLALPNAPDKVNNGGYQASYDVGNHAVLALLGDGANVATPGDGVVELAAAAPSWTPLCNPCGTPRQAQNVVYDPLMQRALMFGGFIGSGADVDGTWAFATDHWEVYDAANPPGRENSATVYDASRDVIVLYGGYRSGCGTNGDCPETWEMVPD
jgi:hypothetical protein